MCEQRSANCRTAARAVACPSRKAPSSTSCAIASTSRHAVCRAQRAWPILYRRLTQTCLGTLRALRSDHELVSSSGARLRGADQPRLFAAKPLRLLQDSDVLAQPACKAGRVSFARSFLQWISRVRGDVDGGPRRYPESP